MGSNPTPRTRDEHPAQDLINWALWLKRKKRLAEITIEGKVRAIRRLMKRVNLWDNQAVEDYIQDASWDNSYKNRLLYAYQDWLKFHGFDYIFEPYYREQKLPYIPTAVLSLMVTLKAFLTNIAMYLLNRQP